MKDFLLHLSIASSIWRQSIPPQAMLLMSILRQIFMELKTSVNSRKIADVKKSFLLPLFLYMDLERMKKMRS